LTLFRPRARSGPAHVPRGALCARRSGRGDCRRGRRRARDLQELAAGEAARGHALGPPRSHWIGVSRRSLSGARPPSPGRRARDAFFLPRSARDASSCGKKLDQGETGVHRDATVRAPRHRGRVRPSTMLDVELGGPPMGRLFRMAYTQRGRKDTEPFPYQLRDAEAGLRLVSTLEKEGFTSVRPLINYPSKGPELKPYDLGIFRSDDLILLCTRPPMDDHRWPSRYMIPRSFTVLEETLFEGP